ncbi:serine hydrolase [Flavivirga abyssicola]|uniref:serine hydrolase n=1 Tax=Flavivirga abyssicola TaxID=3063533 RepID=UPI0026E042EE|nr:serine hydrolase [Flavivirga sp. MEBiC07777]WVK12712.1 serine hydrolase [Flavivirga sp. MEBiC07777]
MKLNSNYQLFKNGSLLLSLLLICNICFAQTKVEQIDKLISTYEAYGKFNGSVLVSDHGKVIYKKGFGMANMEWDIPNQPNTKHRLGSITKQFTAMLILQLAADGKLDLQEPITKYLPDYPKENGDKITTHHLLTHTSGIPNYTSFPKFFQEESRNPYTPDAFVKKFADKALDFSPGEKFSYSNSGYFLLGVIVEKLSGKTYEQMLHDKIFTPLNMNESGYDNHGDILKNRATGYEKRGNKLINSNYLDMSIPYAAGSMYSTVEDLYKWDQALYTNTLLPKDYMEMYFKPYVSAFGRGHYAYGWGVGYNKIGKSADSIYTIGHGGGINGFNTNISRAPSDKSLIVLLNNTGRAPLNQMTRAIRGIIHGKEYNMPKKSVADDLLAVIEEKGIDAGITHYNAIKNSKNYDLRENEMNGIGYQLMRSGKVDEAVKVFKLNVDAFPKSSNVYDSYGEALMNSGKKDLAIENYKKSVELNPNNFAGIEALKKLGADVSEYEKEVVVPDTILQTYIGKFELKPGFIITITKEGSQLKGHATGQSTVDLFPKSENVFYLKVVNAQLTFNKNSEGKVDSITLLQNGKEMRGKRIE